MRGGSGTERLQNPPWRVGLKDLATTPRRSVVVRTAFGGRLEENAQARAFPSWDTHDHRSPGSPRPLSPRIADGLPA